MTFSGNDITIQIAEDRDRREIARLLERWWGSTTIVNRGVAHNAAQLPALVARIDSRVVGLATFTAVDGECELVTINATEKAQGVGSALLSAVAEHARALDCSRLWLITTNDNLDALRFYQRRGMRLVAVHPGGVDAARRLKPSIPPVGSYGIPVRDELELELQLR